MNAARTRLAVDLGTTWTAAAISDADGTRPLHLGDHGAAVPSVVALDDAGALVVGTAAERILAVNPDRGVREIKRRFGDTTPIVLAGAPHLPDALTAALLAGVAAAAGVNPAATTAVLTHPANWGDYKLDLLRNVAVQAGFADVEVVSEPAAAALHYASTGRLAAGDAVAVYDFGGGTFDAAVVRLEADGPALLGAPQGIERLGGIDIDQVVFSHVAAALGGSLQDLDRNDPDVRRAILRLRADCTTAKELLSADSEATIAVAAPGLHTQVRMTREELEGALRPRIAETVRSLERAVASAGLQMADLAGVVLVGGSSRLPIVSEVVAAETGLPVLLDADAKLVVVLGAALPHGAAQPAAAAGPAMAAASVAAAAATVPLLVPEAPASPTATAPTSRQEPTMSDTPINETAAQPTRGAVPPPPPKKKDEGKINPAVVGGVAAAAAAATAAAVVWGDDLVDAVTGGGDDGDAAAATGDLGDIRTADRAAREADAEAAAALVDESMDVFDEAVAAAAAPAPAAPAFGAPAGGGGGGGGGGSSSGQGSSQRSSAPEQESAGRPNTPPPPPPPAAPADAAPAADGSLAVEDGGMPAGDAPAGDAPAADAPVADQAFEDARATLLDRIGTLDLGEGVDPADAADLQAELAALVERYQPLPGQSTEDALAALRDEYDQRVQDFTQDQKIEALIEEEMRDNAEDAAEETPAEEAPLTVDTDGDGVPDAPAPTDPTAETPADGETPADPTAETPADGGEAGGLPEGWTAIPGVAGMVYLDETGNPVSDQQLVDAGIDPSLPGLGADPDDGGEIAADPDDGGEVDGGDAGPGLGIGLDDLVKPGFEMPTLELDPDLDLTVPGLFEPGLQVDENMILPTVDMDPNFSVGDQPELQVIPLGEPPVGIVDSFEELSEMDLGFSTEVMPSSVDSDSFIQMDPLASQDLLGVDILGDAPMEPIDLGVGINPQVLVDDVPGLLDQGSAIVSDIGDLAGDVHQTLDDAVDLPFEPVLEDARDFVTDSADDVINDLDGLADDAGDTISGIADDIGL